ncbi:molybdopterin cofactor-binding domain-containing protein, partial [Streptomyces galilaeus]|uniref:molybdopterin cofactor-binding domain-containing protein n=1 Tax=Streptomyces galilaeus TaxID=33899 RepID=UPI0038F6B8BB
METRRAIGAYDPAKATFTLVAGTQNSHLIRRVLAESVFKLRRDCIDVVTPDVGGGFGGKLFVFPEYVLVLWAARALGRPV